MRLSFLNTEGKVTLDEVRLVDKLTPEEQAVLIPAGLNLRLERHEPKPYHDLQAVHTGNQNRFRIHAEVEEAALTPPLRQHFVGECSNFRCGRVWKETPAETTGEARMAVSVPAQGRYEVWVRCKGEGVFRCQVAERGTSGRVSSAAWSWVKAEQPLVLAKGRQEITLASESDGLSLDLLLLTTEADPPAAVDERNATPAPVEGLRLTASTATETRLAWADSTDPALDHYSVYVGDTPDFTPGNATILASGRKAEVLDWGLKPGSTLFYKAVATNKRGVSSAPTTVRVEVPALETATVELKIEDANLSGGLVRGESRDVACAWLPEPLAKDAQHPRATWQYTVPRDGTYYLWARCTTYDAMNVSVFWIETDGQPQAGGVNWRLRFPCTLTRHLDGTKPGEETWFTDKVMSAWWAGPVDCVSLAAGAHTLGVAFDPTHAPRGPRLAAVYLSSDPSYRPPGYDPRIDFVK